MKKSVLAWAICTVLYATTCVSSSKDLTINEDIAINEDFKIDEAGTIKRYYGNDTELVIPDRINGVRVTGIGDWAFSKKKLISVTIPDGVTAIGYESFANNQLSSISMPDSITVIGWGAFSHNQLTSITISENLIVITDYAFAYNQLTSVSLSERVTSIGSRAFFRNRLTSVSIPRSVTSIGRDAFYENLLESVTIGANIRVDISSFDRGGLGSIYNNTGRRSGTYTYNDGKWNLQQARHARASHVFSSAQDKEQVKSLLLEIDVIKERRENAEITAIAEYNFGIPGGTNWLVEWNTAPRSMYIYIVDTDAKEIMFRQFIKQIEESTYEFEQSDYISWYQTLPGMLMENDSCKIGDFNGDGFDEIMQFGLSPWDHRFEILGYNPLEDKIKKYCSLPYAYPSKYETSPVKFISHKGVKGFTLRYEIGDVAGGPDYVPEPHPKNGRRFFFAWNAEQREYVEIEEIR